MDQWPAGHTIGVYLCDGDGMRSVGTARESRDVPELLRHLAWAWEEYGSLPIPERVDGWGDVYFCDGPSSLSAPGS